MRTKVVPSLIGLALVSLIAVGVAVSRGSHLDTVPPNRGQDKPKTLRELAMERDVEVEGVDGSQHLTHMALRTIKREASAIVYGRIVDSRSYFEDSGPPIEHGEYITTEYTVEVLRALRDTTSQTMPPPNQAAPAPLITPLKIARNGGTVLVNGHRAAVKVKGYENLGPGKQYIFFYFGVLPTERTS